MALSDPLPQDNWEGPDEFTHQVAHATCLSPHEDPSEIEFYPCGSPMMLDSLGVDEDMIAYDAFG